MEQISFIECFKAPFDILALYMVLIFNLALTLVHFVKELKGFQWRYLGAIAGLQIPDKLGIISFFVLPLGFVGGLGLVGIVRLFGLAPPTVALLCMGALIGTRISDSIFIHIRPSRQGYCPNPALSTIPYYLAEAAILTVLFLPGLLSHYFFATVGFIIGCLIFYGVLPLLKYLRMIRHVEPWQVKTPIPSWAKEDRDKRDKKKIQKHTLLTELSGPS